MHIKYIETSLLSKHSFYSYISILFITFKNNINNLNIRVNYLEKKKYLDFKQEDLIDLFVVILLYGCWTGKSQRYNTF